MFSIKKINVLMQENTEQHETIQTISLVANKCIIAKVSRAEIHSEVENQNHVSKWPKKVSFAGIDTVWN